MLYLPLYQKMFFLLNPHCGASYYIVIAILYLFYRLGYAGIDAVDCSISAYRIDGSGQDTTTASLYIC